MEPSQLSKTSAPLISSFVIRFVVTRPTASNQGNEALPPNIRGAIRHIQTDQELNFSSWQEAVDFIRQYVPIEVPCSGEG